MQEKSNGQLFESIFNHATIGILVTNSAGKIISINQFGLDIFGYAEADLIGKPVEALIPNRFHSGHVNQRTAYQDDPTTREMGAGRDLYGTRKDGTEFPIEVSLSPFKSATDTFIFAFVIDISVRKKIEASERNYQKKISEILTSLRKEKELNDLQSNFISMASHEFKTPLTTILSSAALLNKYPKTEQQAQRTKHIERIESAVRNINRILNDFLTINKVKAESFKVHYSEFDLEKFIFTIKDDFRFLSKKGQTLKYTHTGEKTVFLDAELLRNILSNLLTNASKFSDPHTSIEINSYCTAKDISISVKDDGYGISQKDQEHIFHRFFRAENALTIAGTGLGLHIVRNYVEIMRGKIHIESELDQGTEIIVSFKR